MCVVRALYHLACCAIWMVCHAVLHLRVVRAKLPLPLNAGHFVAVDRSLFLVYQFRSTRGFRHDLYFFYRAACFVYPDHAGLTFAGDIVILLGELFHYFPCWSACCPVSCAERHPLQTVLQQPRPHALRTTFVAMLVEEILLS